MVIFFRNHFGSRLDLKRARAQATPNSCLVNLPWEHGLCNLRLDVSCLRRMPWRNVQALQLPWGHGVCISVSISLVRDFCQARVFGISIAMKAWRMQYRRDSSSTESSANFVLKLSSLSFIAFSCSLLNETILKQHVSSILLKPSWFDVSCSCKSSFEYGFSDFIRTTDFLATRNSSTPVGF